MRADRQIDLAARSAKLIGDLDAGGTCAHDENGAVGKLLGLAVAAGVHLQRDRAVGHEGREDRLLERSGRGDDIAGADRPVRSLHGEARSSGVLADRGHLDAALDRRADLLRVGDEVVGDLVLASKPVRRNVEELQAREAIVPRRAVGDQRVPALRCATALRCDCAPGRGAARRSRARCSLIATPA